MKKRSFLLKNGFHWFHWNDCSAMGCAPVKLQVTFTDATRGQREKAFVCDIVTQDEDGFEWLLVFLKTGRCVFLLTLTAVSGQVYNTPTAAMCQIKS